MECVFGYRYLEESSGIRLFCESEGKEWLGIDIYPEAGFKSAALSYRGDRLQPYHPRWSGLLKQAAFGNCILFPTPNRVRDSRFVFHGQRVDMIKNGQPRNQHGLALDSRWELLSLERDCRHVWAKAQFSIREGDENFLAFPWECTLTAIYCLTENALSFSYQVKNDSCRPMPFGIGLHPWFLLPDGENVALRMPAEYCFETETDLLPTGKLLAVRGRKEYDLNHFRQVRALDLDTVFLTNAGDVYLRYDERDYQIRIHTTEEFKMGVVFTAFSRGMDKKGYEAFCVETQSCCTDAINMYEKGFMESGLTVLAPGEEKSGEIIYYLEACAKGGEE